MINCSCSWFQNGYLQLKKAFPQLSVNIFPISKLLHQCSFIYNLWIFKYLYLLIFETSQIMQKSKWFIFIALWRKFILTKYLHWLECISMCLIIHPSIRKKDLPINNFDFVWTKCCQQKMVVKNPMHSG